LSSEELVWYYVSSALTPDGLVPFTPQSCPSGTRPRARGRRESHGSGFRSPSPRPPLLASRRRSAPPPPPVAGTWPGQVSGCL